MLDAFDRARRKAKDHEIETYHGGVGERRVRKWLRTFLPRKYGVTAGYVVSQGIRDEKLPHFDVIIYDRLESPILWVEESGGRGEQARAVPAEHVRAVLEVKASLTPKSVGSAIDHLFDLQPVLAIDPPGEPYKTYLPDKFISCIVFFDLTAEYERSYAALDKLIPATPLRGYQGGVILRGEGHDPDTACRIRLLKSDRPREDAAREHSQSLLRACVISASREWSPGAHISGILMWSRLEFAIFAFDLVAMLDGTYQPGLMSSFHGYHYEKRATAPPADDPSAPPANNPA
jgi:hypothetical protein